MSVELLPVSELKGQFVIPDYQRGYRWDKEQVKGLLDDIEEFNQNRNENEIYCLQPLVLAKKDKSCKVVDGQQRLTTLFILLKLLNEDINFSIKYDSRDNSESYLERINSSKIADTITEEEYMETPDYYYMWEAKKKISEWLDEHRSEEDFTPDLWDRICFIEYDIDGQDEIKVFKRLNIGRISLTESELIKALFLNENNFHGGEDKRKRDEIANEWDMIEQRLQDDRFWMFFHGNGFASPTRMDFILDVVKHRECVSGENNRHYPIFDFFYNEYKKYKENRDDYVRIWWNKVLEVFYSLEEWYNDEELFHYIGFLAAVEYNNEIDNICKLVKLYIKKRTKRAFSNELKKEIKKRIFDNSIKKECKDRSYLDYEYEIEINGKIKHPKRLARPILLLHNIQIILDQNACLKDEKKYSLPNFYRFPFHLYKKDHWDIEHIRPDHSQNFQGPRKKKMRKKYVYSLEKALKQQGYYTDKPSVDDKYKDLLSLLNKYSVDYLTDNEETTFHELYDKANEDKEEELKHDQRNKIWNYTLLDSSTNREYGNYWFSIKREYVIKKENGIKPMLEVNDTGDVIQKDISETAFVPVSTRNVFAKGYTRHPSTLECWTTYDAACYRLDIERRLWWYLTDEIKKALGVDSVNKERFDKIYEKYEKCVLENEKNYSTSMFVYCMKNKDDLVN